MPITDTLKNAESFRRVGFTEEQANLLAETFEQTAHAQSEDLKSFIRAELGAMEGRLEAKLDNLEARTDTKIEGLRADMQSALRDQLLKIVISTIAIVSLAVTILKLFPNAG